MVGNRTLLKKWLHKYCIFFHDICRDVLFAVILFGNTFGNTFGNAFDNINDKFDDPTGGVVPGDAEINVVVPLSETCK